MAMTKEAVQKHQEIKVIGRQLSFSVHTESFEMVSHQLVLTNKIQSYEQSKTGIETCPCRYEMVASSTTYFFFLCEPSILSIELGWTAIGGKMNSKNLT